MTREQFEKLKAEVEEAREAAARAEGQRDVLLRRLREDFNVENLKTAKKLLAALSEKRDKAQQTFDKAVGDYERKWKRG